MAETFEQVLSALAQHRRLRKGQVKQLSGLASKEVQQLEAVWSGLPASEKLQLLATLRRHAEEDRLVDFAAVYEMAMGDPSADVRRVAVLASSSEESARPALLEKLMQLCGADPDEMVRGAAAERLGGFAYEAEVGRFSDSTAREMEQVLLERAGSETEAPAVRAAALASVGYFSTPSVRAEIRRALSRSPLRLAAVRAIERNADPVWIPEIKEQMGSQDPAIRREAAEAAANFEETVDALSDLVDDPDVSVRMAAIDSLGKIGSPEARDTLIYCYESPDPEVKQAATRALQEIEEREDPLGSAGLDWEEE